MTYAYRHNSPLAIKIDGIMKVRRIQAEELRAWLMTLAVDAARIGLLNDVQPNEALKIEVVK